MFDIDIRGYDEDGSFVKVDINDVPIDMGLLNDKEIKELGLKFLDAAQELLND